MDPDTTGGHITGGNCHTSDAEVQALQARMQQMQRQIQSLTAGRAPVSAVRDAGLAQESQRPPAQAFSGAAGGSHTPVPFSTSQQQQPPSMSQAFSGEAGGMHTPVPLSASQQQQPPPMSTYAPHPPQFATHMPSPPQIAPAGQQFIQPYQSLRLPPVPTNPLFSVGTFQPIAGIQALNRPLSTNHANQARVQSAAQTIPPRNPANLPRRRCRAATAPSLPRHVGPTAEDCTFSNGEATLVRITAKICPRKVRPAVSRQQPDLNPANLQPHHMQYPNMIVQYMGLHDSVDHFLAEHDLIYRYEVPNTVRICDIIRRLVQDMQTNGFVFGHEGMRLPGWQTPAHEALPLRLLECINRGRPRNSTSASHLRVSTLSALQPLSVLVADTRRFSNSNSIEGNRLVVHFRE